MTENSVAEIKFIPATAIVSRVDARSLKNDGIERLRTKIERLGFQPDKPLRVYPVDGGYRLIDGNHRLEAAIKLALNVIPALIVEKPADELAEIQQARESNEASETVVPTTFVDDAELVWRLTETFTQEQTAKAMGWSRAQVSQYAMLNKINDEAWRIVATSFYGTVASEDDDEVADYATTVATPFSERLLRNILDLDPGQQVELCGYLAKGKDKKGHKYGKADFKNDAVWYRAFNILWNLAEKQLSAKIPDPAYHPYLGKVHAELKANSEYTDEWLKSKAPGDKFNKLIQAQIDDWQQKNNIQIIIKDLRLLTAADIAGESVDCIITDPPYPKDFIELFDDLGALAARVLKPGGSLVVMTGQLYLPRYIELLSKHLTYHWILAYTTPGGQAVQVWNQEVNTFWKPLLWFVKDQRDSRWVSDVVNTPVNANDKQHHHWGQSVEGMQAIVEKFTNPGDCILDPFLGGGTTGLVCKATRRKFIGVEIDEGVAKQALARIHGGKA